MATCSSILAWRIPMDKGIWGLYSCVVQFSCSVVSDSLWPHLLQHARPPCPSPAPRVYSHSHPSVMPSNHLVLCHPLLLLPSVFPSFRVFSNQSVFPIRWPKYWSFIFSISSSNESSGLISFKIDCFDPLAVKGTLRSLILHPSSKSSLLSCAIEGPARYVGP